MADASVTLFDDRPTCMFDVLYVAFLLFSLFNNYKIKVEITLFILRCLGSSRRRPFG